MSLLSFSLSQGLWCRWSGVQWTGWPKPCGLFKPIKFERSTSDCCSVSDWQLLDRSDQQSKACSSCKLVADLDSRMPEGSAAESWEQCEMGPMKEQRASGNNKPLTCMTWHEVHFLCKDVPNRQFVYQKVHNVTRQLHRTIHWLCPELVLEGVTVNTFTLAERIEYAFKITLESKIPPLWTIWISQVPDDQHCHNNLCDVRVHWSWP